MDIAYDHIQEDAFPDEDSAKQSTQPQPANLSAEFQEAYKVIASSPWGARLGGFFGSVKKQSESYYAGARQEYSAASSQATRGFTELRTSLLSRTRALSLNQHGSDDLAGAPSSTSSGAEEPTASVSSTRSVSAAAERPESLPADIVKEAASMVSRFRSEAAKRLKDIEKAEDAADEALLKFGSNIRNFLRDAVTIAPPEEHDGAALGRGAEGGAVNVLFESTEADTGRRVVHGTRFDAQLHVIHSNADSFLKDPVSPEWEAWRQGFDVSTRTVEIARDLEKYDTLRLSMEKLVPERVSYEDFWGRYYFLRHVVEMGEQKRRELLKGAATASPEEDIAWDEDSDDESPTSNPTPTTATTTSSDTNDSTITRKPPTITSSSASTTLTEALPEPLKEDADLLKPVVEGRRSNDQQSQADSDASYDLISGTTSRAPGSPKEEKKKDVVAEESDGEDWE